MTTLLQYFRRATRRSSRSDTVAEPLVADRRPAAPASAIAIVPNDPLVAYFLSVFTIDLPAAVES